MPPTVQLFITCILDTLYPETGEAVARVLERAGVSVACPPGQTCCGQPAFNAGMRAEARHMAEHIIEVFEKAPGDVVIPSGSCAAMIRHGYLELFAGDAQWLPRARALAGRSYEFTQYLVDVLGVVNLGARLPEKITYHSSCHLLRDLGVDRQPRLLLDKIAGAEFVELEGTAECCGFGGVFSVEHPEISAEMLARKLANIQASGATRVAACDGGCVTNINGGLRRLGRAPIAAHIADLLDAQAEG
ncbi:MAG: (Fe-S)-binding protein [Chloroflexi bacterium]|nr:(Fe-S)-binding protein [Chloroflexota bacterium]